MNLIKTIILFIWHIPRNISVLLIKIYQTTLSLDHGPLRHLFPFGFCKFTPSCSQYGLEAILKHGFIKGWLMAIYRILRCNPCSKGGIDKP